MDLKEKALPMIRDVVFAIAIVGLLLAILWGYTGQFPHSPMVVVTSGSMMHEDAPFGRIGTIDPGDLVLVKKIHWKDDVITRGPSYAPTTKHKTYGDYGDVIIYIPDRNGDGIADKDATPIIHRAICWVQVNPDGTYTIEEYGLYNVSSITISELGLSNYKPPHNGFITKGDHNPSADQATRQGSLPAISTPVKPEWIIGKARGEVPWFGLIKLVFFGDENIQGEPGWVRIGNAVAPKDEWICLGISLFILIGIPTIWDAYKFYKKWKSEKLRL